MDAWLNGNLVTRQDLANHARSTNASDPEPKYYHLLGLAEPLNPDNRKKLEEMEIKILEHIGNNIFLVCYDASNATESPAGNLIEQLTAVPPDYKITNTLSLSPKWDKQESVEVTVFLHSEEGQVAHKVAESIQSRTGISPDMMLVNKDATCIRLRVTKDNAEAIATIDSVRGIHKVHNLITHNHMARKTINADISFNNTKYTGEGQVMTVADTGLDKGDRENLHPAFGERVIKLRAWYRNEGDDRQGHGTHVCGSVLGNDTSELYGNIQGTAPGAEVIFQSLSDEDNAISSQVQDDFASILGEAYNSGSRVHTNSWGFGWEERNPMIREPYELLGLTLDNFVWNHPDMTVCVPAGNAGRLYSKGIKSQIEAHGSAKNCITVGSCGSTHQNPGPNVICDFSSCGPTLDGRIKPDVVAPGEQILSAASRSPYFKCPDYRESDDPLWVYDSGTSMSTPLVAGCVAVLRQVLIEDGVDEPSAALLKAMLINGATSLGWPRELQGFGRVNLAASVIKKGDTTDRGFYQGVLCDQIDKRQDKIEVKLQDYMPPGASCMELKTTLVYTDLPGRSLQHRVSLSVQITELDGDYTYSCFGNAKSHDKANNVEQVVCKDLMRNTNVTLIVSIKNTFPDSTTEQPFALVWSVSDIGLRI